MIRVSAAREHHVSIQFENAGLTWRGFVNSDRLLAFLVESGTLTGADYTHRNPEFDMNSWASRLDFVVATSPDRSQFVLMPSSEYAWRPLPPWHVDYKYKRAMREGEGI